MQEIEARLPFKFEVSQGLSSWRAQTFWTKEPETLAWIRKFADKNADLHFLDVGANVGVYSLFALSVSTSLEVTAIEPSEHNFPALLKNIALNQGWDKRITCLNFPLSNYSGQGFWREVSDRVGDSGHQVSQEKSAEAMPVRTMTGDEIVQDISTKLVLLKIDVDGHEISILQGFERSLREGKIASVLVELDRDQFKVAQSFLTGLDYKLDVSFDSTPGHSSFRRQELGSSVRNFIFSHASFI